MSRCRLDKSNILKPSGLYAFHLPPAPCCVLALLASGSCTPTEIEGTAGPVLSAPRIALASGERWQEIGGKEGNSESLPAPSLQGDCSLTNDHSSPWPRLWPQHALCVSQSPDVPPAPRARGALAHGYCSLRDPLSPAEGGNVFFYKSFLCKFSFNTYLSPTACQDINKSHDDLFLNVFYFKIWVNCGDWGLNLT